MRDGREGMFDTKRPRLFEGAAADMCGIVTRRTRCSLRSSIPLRLDRRLDSFPRPTRLVASQDPTLILTRPRALRM